MNDLIQYSPAAQFLALLKNRTRVAYALDLRTLATWLSIPPRAMTLQQFIEAGPGAANMTVMQYRQAMLEVKPEPLKPATINHRLAAIRSLLTHLRRTGLITWAIDVPGLKNQTYKDTRGPSAEQVKRLCETALSSSPRDYAIIRLLIDNALRREEVASIQVSDLDLGGMGLWVLRKGKNEKLRLTINDPTSRAIQEWLPVRGNQDGSLFGISGRAVHLIVSRLAKSCGFKSWPHALRHHSITAIGIASNGNAAMMQAHGGFASMKTVTIYMDNLEDLQGQAARLLAKP